MYVRVVAGRDRETGERAAAGRAGPARLDRDPLAVRRARSDRGDRGRGVARDRDVDLERLGLRASRPPSVADRVEDAGQQRAGTRAG